MTYKAKECFFNLYFSLSGRISYPESFKLKLPPADEEEEKISIPGSPYPTMDALLDFSLLTLCNHSIYDMGSFGFWAASLAGGMTILADGYYQTPHPLLKAIKENPPEKWELLNVNELQN